MMRKTYYTLERNLYTNATHLIRYEDNEGDQVVTGVSRPLHERVIAAIGSHPESYHFTEKAESPERVAWLHTQVWSTLQTEW